jgi:hypothetical protein
MLFAHCFVDDEVDVRIKGGVCACTCACAFVSICVAENQLRMALRALSKSDLTLGSITLVSDPVPIPNANLHGAVIVSDVRFKGDPTPLVLGL